jgi:1-acyl-sn-glycerol-3-phosphate acyltransferase
VLTVLALTLYALNRVIMFRLRVAGAAKLPDTGAFVITPNHVSDLDGLAIAAALPWSRFRRLY